MNVAKRVLYMFLGGFVALGLVFGAYAAFAQSDDAVEETTPETESDGEAVPESAPFPGRAERRGFDARPDGEALADALGITVDELQAARESAFEAALEQAVGEGLLTEAEAEVLRERPGLVQHIPGVRNLGETIDMNQLLADALGITVDELQAARDTARETRLAQMVEEGVLTQEQADQIVAVDAVRDYVDRDALQATVRGFYEDAIEQALADGEITAEQAEQMLEVLENRGPRGFDGPGFEGHRGPRGGHRGPGA